MAVYLIITCKETAGPFLLWFLFLPAMCGAILYIPRGKRHDQELREAKDHFPAMLYCSYARPMPMTIDCSIGCPQVILYDSILYIMYSCFAAVTSICRLMSLLEPSLDNGHDMATSL